MKQLRRWFAGFLCLCMIFTSGNFPTYAMESQQDNQYVEAEEATATDAEDISTSEDISTTEDISMSEDKEDTEDVKTEAELSYLVLGSDYIETPGSQYVLAGVGEEDTVLEAATLYYKNNATGTEYTKNVDVISGNAALFNLDFMDASLAGTYNITGIDVTVNGTVTRLIPSDAGIEAAFGVNVEISVNPDAWVCEGEEETAGVILTDAEGNDLTPDDVAQAIAEVGAGNSLARAGVTGEYVIVLDPGHGGTDSGASYNGIYEKDVNLKIAKYCKAQLEQYVGVKVYMTRSSDVYVGLAERVEYANSVNADLFISIHNNASTNPETHGANVYYPNNNYKPEIGAQGKALATIIQKKLVALGLYNGGIHIRNSETGDTYADGSLCDYYAVIRAAKKYGFPGLIVEHAFVSNADDAATYLSSNTSLKKLGVADAKAIASYLGLKTTTETVYGTLDYSAVYNFDYYVKKYPDVKKAYANDPTGALKHFIEVGMPAGRQGCSTFNVTAYKARYSDLRKAFGSDLTLYYIHYIEYGKAEGRNGKVSSSGTSTTEKNTTEKSTTKKTTTQKSTTEKSATEKSTTETKVPEKSKYVTVYNGVDYSAVYSFEYYTSKYGDIKKIFGNDPDGALAHFVTYGMKEGRQGISTFDVTSYRNKYSDLRRAFGSDLVKYYMHYIAYGQKEGRIATGVTTLQNGTTVYNGVDYRAVYNYSYYLSHNPDVKAVLGDDENTVLAHFVVYGMKEGRQGCSSFDVTSYRNAYADLRKAFGSNLQLYYMHYITYGKSEGRTATGVTTLQNPTTVYNGVNYKAVYDYNYYIKNNPDVKKAFGGDENAVLAHFVNYGMQEGRQANEEFNVKIYKANYGDLSKAFGSDLKKYYLHYISSGKKEKRVANKSIKSTTSTKYTIMGDTSTTVKQMMAYYNANATYPTYYKNTDAPTLKSFCQMYIDECAAEGVKAEVAFCQAMKETGFLQYGGQVDISQFNFAGLGATDSGASGASFSSVREGIRAQVQHLKAYASTKKLNNPCVDTRFSYVKRGSAIYVEYLGIQENPKKVGWATAKNYGYSIRNDYINKLLKY